MSVRTMARVWAESTHSGTHLLMLLAIADFADDDGNAYPAVPTLAKKCRMQSRNANVILAALRASGELQVRPNEGPHGTNRYRIVMGAQGVQSLAGDGMQERAPPQERAPLQRLARTPAKACSKPLQGIADEPSENHQGTTKRERARASRNCPDSFEVSQALKDWAAGQHPEVDRVAETAKFRDQTFKQPISEWDRAWRNWIRRAAEFSAATPRKAGRVATRADFSSMDYRKGINADGNF